MVNVVRTNSENQDFKQLVKQLDAYLKVTDGDEHDFYNQFNNIDVLKHTIVAYINNIPVGCGAFKKYDDSTVEVKRMYTNPEFRNLGIAAQILSELENWAKELNFNTTILETGKRQIEAVHFYKKNNYQIIPNFGQYANMDNSMCFKKILSNEKR
ncbi:GNAT family N-acetyltransferase [Hanstruepera neustonica]|uniref:GNAT family N-acetyltransferase n=1 Tax=Hanstruepera neustonica TaxID=1445657 RepID=A0A2K1DZ71_9FLAO|nr:GNAT family N-acetyltransferase [Hanstruepera neustonica]PNQ73325.1 GNAT family N-acetyltransferase [Hanstruepera neustonica]